MPRLGRVPTWHSEVASAAAFCGREASVSRRMARGIAAAASGLAGLAAGVATIMVTGKWTWTWGLALGVAALVLVVSQVWLSLDESGSAVVSSAAGAISVGGSVKGDVTTDVVGQPPVKDALDSENTGVAASGPGAIAIRRNARGNLRARWRQ